MWSSKQARLTYMMSGNFSKYSEGLVIRTISRCIFLLMVAAVLLYARNEIEIKISCIFYLNVKSEKQRTFGKSISRPICTYESLSYQVSFIKSSMVHCT